MKVLLFGLGRMGERYRRVLEFLYPKDLLLYTVDPKLPRDNTAHHYAHAEEVPNETFDLGIDAHPNENRKLVASAFVERDIPKIIIEKPLGASMQEILEIEFLLNSAPKRPAILSPSYMRFAPEFAHETFTRLDAGPLRSVVITGGALGIGCNGIHYADLANFWFRSTPIKVYGDLQMNCVPSPRGSQFMDHAGTLIATYSTGDFVLQLLPNSTAGVCFHLIFERGRIVIHDQTEPKWFWYRQPSDTWHFPIYRTSGEVLVQPPKHYDLSTEHLMRLAIAQFMRDDEVPGLQEAMNALKVLAFAILSSQERCALAWDNSDALSTLTFPFT